MATQRLIPGSAVALLAQARAGLAEAAATWEVGERFRLAHLGPRAPQPTEAGFGSHRFSTRQTIV